MNIDINLKVPEEILLTLRENKDNFIIEMRKAIATKYFLNKKLSIGQCAELSEMSEAEFIKYLSSQNISIFNFDSEDELLEDIKNA